MAEQTVKPVAWRVKDYADGWILCAEAEAYAYTKTGHLVEPLFTGDQVKEIVDLAWSNMLTKL